MSEETADLDETTIEPSASASPGPHSGLPDVTGAAMTNVILNPVLAALRRWPART
jgi:hypothetical protein